MIPALRLTRCLELLHLALPVELGVVPQHLPRLLDTDQTFARVIGFRVVRDVWEDKLDELLGRLGEGDVSVGNVEYMRPGERGLDSEAEGLSAVAGIDVAETAKSVSVGTEGGRIMHHSLPSALVRIVLPTKEVAIIPRSDDIAQPDANDLGRRVPSTHLFRHLLAQAFGE